MNKDVYSSHKFVYLLPELQKVKRGEIVSPVNMQIDLTNKCNYDCSFCYYHIHNHLKDFHSQDWLKEEEAIKIIREAKDYGLKSVEITGGGEPLLVKYFREFSQEARDLELERALVTNGVFLDKHIDEVKDYSWVRVSMDAITPEAYTRVHRRDGRNLRRVKRGIEELCKVKDNDNVIGISTIVCRENYQDIVNLTKYAKEIGADNLRISIAHTPQREHIFDGIWDEVVEQIEEAKELQTDDFKVFAFSNRIKDIAGETRGGFCYYHHFTTAVGANGALYPCCYFKYIPKYNFGNLKEQSFQEIWEGEKRKKFIETIARDCPASCWMTEKNSFARYLTLNEDEVPHLNFP